MLACEFFHLRHDSHLIIVAISDTRNHLLLINIALFSYNYVYTARRNCTFVKQQRNNSHYRVSSCLTDLMEESGLLRAFRYFRSRCCFLSRCHFVVKPAGLSSISKRVGSGVDPLRGYVFMGKSTSF